jgi:K+-transporting ATPase KdpF subunit
MRPRASIRRVSWRGAATLTGVNVVQVCSGLSFAHDAPVAGCPGWKPLVGRIPMIVDYVLGGIVTTALLIYLIYVLLRPERF